MPVTRRKLHLDLATLHVETFPTAGAAAHPRGTVAAHADTHAPTCPTDLHQCVLSAALLSCQGGGCE
jgi:hypothetical protein